jgi:hypothetical protein
MRKLNPTIDRLNSMRGRRKAGTGVLACVVFFLFVSDGAAGLYVTSSAHGDAVNGVQRSSMTGYNAGNCGHCHEQHAMVGGAEPAPQGGAPSKYTLFYDNNVGQTDNVCFQCHDNTTTVSQRAIINRSYSYRAGGWSADTLSNILAAFSSTSTHTLVDIVGNIDGKWGYTTDSTPCAACHNPHAAQGDPFNAPNSGKSSAARGALVSRPSLHSRDNNSWGLWGDAAAELMNNYTLNYQAPYYYYTTTPSAYEPAGDTTQDGSNLTDFVTFCTDCHVNTVTSGDAIFTPTLNGGPDGTVAAIDWSAGGDKHGQANGDVGLDILAPYVGTGNVLSCMDCHESHGSPNRYLIRQEVNGQVLSGTVGGAAADFGFLCRECHTDDVAAAHNTTNNNGSPLANGWEWVHHFSGDAPYDSSLGACTDCHASAGSSPSTPASAIACTNCHYHGSSVNDATFGSANRTTF